MMSLVTSGEASTEILTFPASDPLSILLILWTTFDSERLYNEYNAAVIGNV